MGKYELPDFDEIKRRHEEEKAAMQAWTDRVYNVNNAVTAAMIKCWETNGHRHDCSKCGNLECLEAFRAQQELWDEADEMQGKPKTVYLENWAAKSEAFKPISTEKPKQKAEKGLLDFL